MVLNGIIKARHHSRDQELASGMSRIHLDDWQANPLFPSFWQIEKRECMTTVTVSYVVLRCEISALHRVTVG